MPQVLLLPWEVLGCKMDKQPADHSTKHALEALGGHGTGMESLFALFRYIGQAQTRHDLISRFTGKPQPTRLVTSLMTNLTNIRLHPGQHVAAV